MLVLIVSSKSMRYSLQFQKEVSKLKIHQGKQEKHSGKRKPRMIQRQRDLSKYKFLSACAIRQLFV